MAHEILYWRGRSEERGDLIAALNDEGSPVHVVRSLDEIFSRMEEVAIQVLVIDASTSEEEAAERLIDLQMNKDLSDFPVIFLARRAEQRVETIISFYPKILGVEMPCTVGSFIEHFNALVQRPDKISPKKDKKEKPREVFEGLDPANLEASHGGKLFSSANSVSFFDEEALLPEGPEREVVREALQDLTDHDKWLGVHARRTTFVSSAVANALNLGDEHDSNIRSAGLLMNIGLVEGESELGRFDLLRLDVDGRELSKVSDMIKQSADSVMDRVGDEMLAKTLSIVSDLVFGNPVEEDPKLIQDAECVLASELIDRACWETGEWRHSGARRAFRHLRDPVYIHDKEVIDRMARMLSEAVCTVRTIQNRHGRFLTRAHRMEQHQLTVEAFYESEEMYSRKEIRPVEIFDLQPGMVLARPLVALDGFMVLPATTILSADSLLRLWELSTIRGLRTPVAVAKDEGESE